jgi:hypothetical protein
MYRVAQIMIWGGDIRLVNHAMYRVAQIMIEKDRPFILNQTYLLKMLHSLYQTHLENQLESSELLLLTILINILQEIRDVSIEKIATALPIPILFESRRKKIQRFLSLTLIDTKKIWFPIINDWLHQNFILGQIIYVVVDRTCWGEKNLILLSIVYEGRSIPIYFQLLPKLGSSNFVEQKNFLSQVFPVLDKYKILLLGDREFCSVSLANWLREINVAFCLRLKKNENIEIENNIWCQLKYLGLKPGTSLFIEDVKVTKTKQISGFNIAGKWKRKVSKYVAKEGWFILTSMDNLNDAILSYKKRFRIEEMFRDFKSGGYNMEKTQVYGNRFISLVLIISFAYLHATLKGQEIKKKGMQKYIARVKEYGRIQRRHSSFYVGLYSQTWLGFIDLCWNLVEKLMKVNRNKLEYYLRGMRAMSLIQSTF